MEENIANANGLWSKKTANVDYEKWSQLVKAKKRPRRLQKRNVDYKGALVGLWSKKPPT